MADRDRMRSVNSFGVAGLLEQNCDIFYTNDLRARNIGRVSDLVSAKLRESSVDELRIRALLVYGVFQSYAVRGLAYHHDEQVPPISLEVGLDQMNVAIAMTYHWDSDPVPNWAGLSERIDSGKSESPFEKILEYVTRQSSAVIVRYEAKERRIEIVSILNRTNSDAKEASTVVAVDSETASFQEVTNYVELGDLNFSKLLRNPVADDAVSIKGTTSAEEESVRVISGSKEAEDTREKRFIASAEADAEGFLEIREEYESTISELKNTVQELKDRIESAENEASERRFSAETSVADETPILVKGSVKTEEEKDDDWGFHFLKKVWPFTPKNDEVDEAKAPLSPSVEPASVSEPIEIEGGKSPSEAEAAANGALKELQELAESKKSKKLEATFSEIQAEAEPDKAKRWIDSLSSELLQKKAKLTELQRNLTQQMRQRELEFKTSELALKQELKRKEEIIYQGQASIENKNDQIAQLNLAVERASSAASDKESQQIKVKLDRAQRLAQMKEEESKALVSKVRDLENRLIIVQAKAQKGNDLQTATKMQTLEKKVDEYKRVNQRLMESLNSQKEKSSDKEIGDLRRKIDQLDRLNTDSKRNLEKSAFKLRELHESEKKLQGDLARAVEENRNLRKSGGTRGTGDSGSGQAA